MNKENCNGCINDIYKPSGKDCWNYKTAKVVTRYKIHMDAPMGVKKNFTKVMVLDCFYSGGDSRDQHVYVSCIPSTAK